MPIYTIDCFESQHFDTEVDARKWSVERCRHYEKDDVAERQHNNIVQEFTP